MREQPLAYRYSGGSLNAEDPTYIVRQADREFFNGLKAGEFCYVLNSRQMGKSSLRVRTMARLQAGGILCAFIDLTGFGKEGVNPEQWYAGIVRDLTMSCLSPAKFNWRKWWREQRDLLSPVQRLQIFIEEILLVEVKQKIVIFVDEVDRVLSQNFSLDDFFAVIRGCYNLRGSKPDYQRLTWALLGVATPSDLIEDSHATPFNIGIAIALEGFKLSESYPLIEGLKHLTDNPQKLLQEILTWTGGQPFLTQKLCWLAASANTIIPPGKEASWLKRLIQQKLLQNWETQDEPPHLKTIRSRILYSPKSSKKLLLLYQQILQRGKIKVKKSSEYRELQLSGLVVKQGRYLKVCNPVYQSVFNHHWIEKQLLVLDTSAGISLGLVSFTSLAIALLIIGLRSLSLFQGWELATFDLLMRSRPLETKDSRLLIIGATEQDLNNYGYPLPDQILAQLLDKLQKYQPRAIGLDIVRDIPVPTADLNLKGHQALNAHFQNSDNVISVCTFDTNIAPPPASPLEQLGFVDLYDDRDLNSQDDTVRRYLLSRSGNSQSEICQAPYSFAWQMIYLYLEDRQIAIKTIKDNWQFGSLVTKRLQQSNGGYQNLDAQGNQLLINYRNTLDPEQIAPEISLGDILNQNESFEPTLIKDRVVLICVTAPSVQDFHDTPYGELRGTYIHAHAVSQILSAVEDRRPLIWWLPLWGDASFVLFWSFMGGLVIWRFAQALNRIVITTIVAIALYGGCWSIFILGGWLPLVPSALALIISGCSLMVIVHYKRSKIP